MTQNILQRLLGIDGSKPEPLPRQAAARRTQLASARVAVEVVKQRDVETAEAAAHAAHARAREALEVLNGQEITLLRELGVEESQRLYASGSALRKAMAAVRKKNTRAEALALIQVIREANAWSLEHTGAPLDLRAVALAEGKNLVDDGRPDLVTAFVNYDVLTSYVGANGAGECSARIVKAALTGTGLVTEVEVGLAGLERAFYNNVAGSYPPPTEKQAAAFATLYSTTREADRTQALAELRAKKRGEALSAPGYARELPAVEPAQPSKQRRHAERFVAPRPGDDAT